MTIIRLYTAITHVAGQLLGQWIPPPHQVNFSDFHNTELTAHQKCCDYGFSGLNSADWLELLEQDVSSFSPRLTWLVKLLKLRKLTLNQIAEATERHFMGLTRGGGLYVSIHDSSYPPILRQIARPPLGLSLLGNEVVMTAPAIAVIGSRRASYEALKMSVEVGLGCAAFGLGIVSGGAIGCDIAVHEGMLVTESDEISAIIVQAGGLSSLFPKTNATVFSRVLAKGGAIISERLWFQSVRPHDFPSRNRIVSGMCEATIVMAAASRSGSLITAREALEQGRDVYVFGGGYDDIRFEGSNRLIEDGATVFFSATELLDILSINYGALSGHVNSRDASYCQNVGKIDTLKGYLSKNLI